MHTLYIVTCNTLFLFSWIEFHNSQHFTLIYVKMELSIMFSGAFSLEKIITYYSMYAFNFMCVWYAVLTTSHYNCFYVNHYTLTKISHSFSFGFNFFKAVKFTYLSLLWLQFYGLSQVFKYWVLCCF